ncbi:MAG: endolytic transglycosylase MltG [Dehalococcoidia bacterium]
MTLRRVPGHRATAAVLSVAVVLGAAWLIGGSGDDAVSSLPSGGASPAAGSLTVRYSLPPGRSAADVGRDLEEIGVIRSALQFRVLVSFMGLEERLSAGDYEIPSGAALSTIVTLLTVQESVPVIRVTFPEGWRNEEMAQLAEQKGFGPADDFLAAARTAPLPFDFAKDLPVDAVDRQGYLFPDTYIMPVGSTAADLVALMIETLDERFDPELRAAVREQGLTLHEALTLASIVEREAVLEEERPLIAGVFMNRMAAGDLLGADPTVQFVVALDEASVEEYGYWKTELTAADFEIDSPYNTRKVAGLPPAPITNPGLASIAAVAHPAETDDYYFVADCVKADGSHLFARTIEEHDRYSQRCGP